MEVKHRGCYFCGSKTEPVLNSVIKKVIHVDGHEDSGTAVALCSVCIKADVIDLRAKPQRAA